MTPREAALRISPHAKHELEELRRSLGRLGPERLEELLTFHGAPSIDGKGAITLEEALQVAVGVTLHHVQNGAPHP